MTACPSPTPISPRNLAPQIDPKDIDYLEVQRGSYEAEYGDRTYGIFNIVPRTGSSGTMRRSWSLAFGNWFQTNDQLNFGGHTRAFRVLRQLERQSQQLRAAGADRAGFSRRGKWLRRIRFLHIQSQFQQPISHRGVHCARIITRFPTILDPNSPGNQELPQLRSSRQRTRARRLRSLLLGSHLQSESAPDRFALLPLQQASYNASPNDVPVVTNVNQTSNYGGLQASS